MCSASEAVHLKHVSSTQYYIGHPVWDREVDITETHTKSGRDKDTEWSERERGKKALSVPAQSNMRGSFLPCTYDSSKTVRVITPNVSKWYV